MIEESAASLWTQLKGLISENYPISFITIVLATVGFIMATIAARNAIAKMEAIMKALFDELIRRVK